MNHSATSNGPPAPGPRQGLGFGGVPYRVSSPSRTSKLKTDIAATAVDLREVGHEGRRNPPTSGNTSKLIAISPTGHEPDAPRIYTPQTPAETTIPSTLGWTTGEEDITPPAPLDVRTSGETAGFDPERVPKPSYNELEKPYGGTKHFMMAHGLRYYDQEDCEVRREILEQLKALEWQNRVNIARDEYVRSGKASEGLLAVAGRGSGVSAGSS